MSPNRPSRTGDADALMSQVSRQEGLTVLSLCDRSGVMVQPWIEAGYRAIIVDLQHEGVTTDGPLTRVGADVRTWEPPALDYAAVFAFPPCTHLAASGARWFQE